MTPSDLLASGVPCAHISYPDYYKTYGDEVAELSAMAGFPPDPEQRAALDLIFAVDRYGKSAAFEVCIVCARQNLKTGLLKQCALGWLYITEQRLIVWTAHEFSTAQESFRDMRVLIENTPDLDREVKAVHQANGDEAIELKSGQRLKFKARTKGGGRGWTGNKVILDESMYLKPVHMGSLLPTLSAVPDPQVVMAGSAGLLESDVQRAVRERGRRGGDPSLVYMEWCAPDGGCESELCDHSLSSKGCALDNQENWRLANPALGRRIAVEYIEAERRAMPPAEFARERLGWWEDPVTGSSGITTDMWTACADPDAEIIDAPKMSVDVSPNRWTAISMSGHTADGLVLIEVPEFKAGTDWVVARCSEIGERWGVTEVIIDPIGPVGALIPDFERAGFTVITLTGKDMAQACGMFYNATADCQLRHLGNDDWLNLAVSGAARRKLGDAWAWQRRTSLVDIAPLVAATLSFWAWSRDEGPADPGVYVI